MNNDLMVERSFAERRAAENKERAEHKSRLECQHMIAGHPKADLLYQLAWDFGHSAGFDEVAGYYYELVSLLK